MKRREKAPKASTECTECMVSVSPGDLLTCPISLNLLSDPVQTPCCGNTFNRESLRHALPRCPLCRVNITEGHPNFNVEKAPRNRTVAHMVGMYEDKRDLEALHPRNNDTQDGTITKRKSCKAQSGQTRSSKRVLVPLRPSKRVLVPLHLSMTTEELLSDDCTDAEFQVGSAFDVRLKQELHESAIKAGLRASTHISAIKERAGEEFSKHAVQG